MRKMTLTDIYRWLEDQAGHPLHSDEGVMFGDPCRCLEGVTVCWMPSPQNIAAAASEGHALLHHEALLFPYPMDNKQELKTLHWPVNRRRLEALGRGNLVASRLHGTIDELWIYDEFAERLGLVNVAAKGKSYCHRIFEIEPAPLEKLVERVKKATGMAALRRTRVKPDRRVRKIGLTWGGMGLFVNVAYQQELLDLAGDIDVMIAGETDNYGFRFCTELDIDVIETSHEVSENAGLGRFADALSGRFPSLRVRHLSDSCVWCI